MKHLLAVLSLSAALLAQAPVCAACVGGDSMSADTPRVIASAKAKKPAAPAEKAPPAPKPETPRKKPALPRHLFM
jgi:hypothetical protein